jgi:hypothetical protein
MAIIRGTTPTLTFHVKNEQLDLNDIAEIWVTFKTKAGVRPKEKTFDINDVVIDAEEKTVELYLTQEDTLFFSDSAVWVQLRVRFNSDLAYASSIIDVDIDNILKEGVI